MDIALKTNAPDASLEFREVQRFGDSSGFAAFVVIRSRGFAAATTFTFETKRLKHFLSDLDKLNSTLSGIAELKPTWESGAIRLEGDGRGSIRVHGELVDDKQRLEFSFVTDQTCLSPLLQDFRDCLALPVT
jgi:hypothetical protein